MKLLQVAAIALLQLVVTGPIIVFFPFAVFIFLPMLPINLFTGDQAHMVKSLAYGLGGAGLLGLYTAILIPHHLLRRVAALRWLVVAGIACGFLATLILLFLPEESSRLVDNLDVYRVWLLGGPVVVGAWNLWRLARSETAPPVLAASPT